MDRIRSLKYCLFGEERRRFLMKLATVVLLWGLLPSAALAESDSSEASGKDPYVATSAFDNLGSLIRDNWFAGLILGACIFAGLAVGMVASVILKRRGEKWKSRGWQGRSQVVSGLAGPAKLALLTVGLAIGLIRLDLSDLLRDFLDKSLLFLATIAVGWYAYNLVGVIEIVLRRQAEKTESTLDDQLVPLVRKTLRMLLAIVLALFVVDKVFGRDIGAWLAGLGIAGLAVSLAAQDSLKNLFGSVTILFDRPFQVGDRIKYGGFDGNVTDIGFRSTKILTKTGHLVTIPNSNIVNDPVENVAHRKFIRRTLNVTITYDTPREKIDQAVQIIRDILEEDDLREPIHAVIDGDELPPRVFFNDFNAESLNIFVMYWYAPPAWWDYLEHGQRINLRIFEEYEKAGIEFAFPTQTLYLAGDPKRELVVRMLEGERNPEN